MNLLSLIIERLNQRVAAYNLFDQIYGLSELNQNGNEKAWVNYIGDGQAQVVSDYDGANGTIFWAKRGRVSLSKNEQYNSVSCKQLYLTSIPLTAYAIVRRSSLPCDGADSVDFVANQIFKYVSGKDVDFRIATGLIQYDVVPASYGEETKSLSKNYEWACVTVDFNIEITSDSNDGCYAPCDNVPLPPYSPPVGSCCNIAIYDEGQIITESVTQIDFVGVGVSATSVGGAVTVTIIGEPAEWGTIGTGTGVSSQTDLVNYLLANFYPLLSNPSGFLVAADLIPYLTYVDAALLYFPIPTGTISQYIRGDGSIATFPALTGFVPYTGATADVNLGTHDLTAERGTFANNGSSDTLTVNHTSGSGYGIIVTKGGNNEALYVSKTSGSGNAMTVIGGRTSLVDLALSSVTNTAGDFLTLSGGVVHKRTSAEVRTDIGAGTVTSVAALTLSTSGTDLSSTVANGTTTPVITLNVPTASALNRGALSSADWTTFNDKAPLASPALTGSPTAPTQTAGDNSTNIATTAYVDNAVTSSLTGSMYEASMGLALQTTRGLAYVASENKLFVSSDAVGNVRIFNATTLELLATVAITSALECDYISSVNEVWCSNSTTGLITRINAATNAVAGTIANAVLVKRQFIEYANPLSGDPRVYVLSTSGAATTIPIISLVSFTVTGSITYTVTDVNLSGVLIMNSASAMDRHIVICTLSNSIGLRVINCELNTLVASSIVPTGLSAGNAPFYIDYKASTDKLFVSYNAINIIAVLTPLTTSTFTTVSLINTVLNPIRVRYDSANDLLLVTSRGGITGSNIVYFSKFTGSSYVQTGGLTTNARQNVSVSQIQLSGGGTCWVSGAENTVSNVSQFVKIKYA
jgi:hypothetical protein